MAVRNEAFLAVSEALSNQVGQAWAEEAQKLSDRIVAALEAGDRKKAMDLAAEASMEPFAQRMRKKWRSFGAAAAVFGAKTLSGDEKTAISGVQKVEGQGPIEQTQNAIEQSTELATATVAEDGTQALQRGLTQQITDTPVDFADLGEVERARAKSAILNKAVGTGQGYSQVAGDLHASRLSVWGFTKEAEVRGITRYQINEVLDGRTCAVCQHMHGKTFSVEQAAQTIESVLDAQNPTELKTSHGWPPQTGESHEQFLNLSRDDMASNGWNTPPFHPGCRGILNEVGTVTTGQDFEAAEGLYSEDRRMDALSELTGRSKASLAKAAAVGRKPIRPVSQEFGLSPEPYEALSDAEINVARLYTSGYYEDINKMLRLGQGDESVRNTIDVTTDTLNNALDKMPSYQGPVYRGMGVGTGEGGTARALDDLAEKYIPGEVVTEPAFVSTSTTPEAAFGGSVQYVIRSKTGAQVAPVSHTKTEAEVLFKAGKQFEVVEIDRAGEMNMTIYLEEVDDG